MKLNSRVYCADIYAFKFPRESYDAFVFFSFSYSLIPSSKRRIEILKRLHGSLDSDGCILINFEPYEGWGHRLARLAAGIGRATSHPSPPREGDVFSPGLGYQHLFTRQEIEAESLAANYRLTEYLHDGRRIIAVLKKAV